MNESYYVDTSYGLSSTTGLFGAIAGMMALIWIIIAVIGIVQIVAMWKVFTKAGKPGWASIIPIYNIYVMCEIGGKEWWYILLTFIPVVNIFALFMICNGIAQKFGKGVGFTIGMVLLPPIFFMILGFGKSNVYLGDDNVGEVDLKNLDNNEEGTNADSMANINGAAQPVAQNEGYVAPSFDTPVMGQEINQTINNFNVQASQMMGQAPVMNEQPAQVVDQTPIMNEQPAQVLEQTPIMNEQPAQVVEQTPVMNEQPAQVVEQTPVMNEQPAQVVEQTPVMNEQPAQVLEQTPVMNEQPAQVVEQTPVMNEQPAQVVEQTPVMNEQPIQAVEQAPVMNEPASNVNETQPLQQEVDTTEKPKTSLWANNTNNEQM